MNRRQFSAVALGALTVPAVARGQTARPLVIAHRGASGLRPEHTLMAYDLAIAQGADVIEPDLVVTSDGVLICRHESDLTDTTDISDKAEFSGRARDGRWLAEDFTLAEVQSLRAKERLPDQRPGNTRFDGREPPPTFQQAVDLAEAQAGRLGRPVGIYPELKQAAELKAKGFDTGELLLNDLAKAGLPSAANPVFIQSFEPQAVKALVGRTAATLVQVTSDPALLTPQGLAEVASYARGLGPEKSLVTAELTARAHDLGLAVHPWTFRAENAYLPADLRRGEDRNARGDLVGEIRRYLDMGIDGFFTDFPAIGVEAVERAAG
jgi:glycerophosphoryl diester phosphodiesterase